VSLLTCDIIVIIVFHEYLTEKKQGKALDPVTNFHVQNGTSVDRLYWKSDPSEKGFCQSATASGEGEAKPPPLAGTNVMNIIVVAAECAPWSKTGGLGDEVGALPKALARRGHRVMVVAPRYSDYREGQDTGVHKRYNIHGQEFDVSYYQAYIDNVDFVFINSPIFQGFNNNIYQGNREEDI